MSAIDIKRLDQVISNLPGGSNALIDDPLDMPPPYLGLDKSSSTSQFLIGPGPGLNLNKSGSFLGGGPFLNFNRESSAFTLKIKDEKNSPEPIYKNGVIKNEQDKTNGKKK